MYEVFCMNLFHCEAVFHCQRLILAIYKRVVPPKQIETKMWKKFTKNIKSIMRIKSIINAGSTDVILMSSALNPPQLIVRNSQTVWTKYSSSLVILNLNPNLSYLENRLCSVGKLHWLKNTIFMTQNIHDQSDTFFSSFTSSMMKTKYELFVECNFLMWHMAQATSRMHFFHF